MSHSFDSRELEQLVTGQAVSDGAGVRLLRVLGAGLQARLDPFLMLDEFRSDNPDDYLAGFPDHPHRGFETVTYMRAGLMRHHDNAGNSGLLGPGGVQWMTAGRGIVHSELPEQQDGLMHGFQLWVNLPAQHKMCPPSYQDLPSASIPEVQTAQGNTLRLIAGHWQDQIGAVQPQHTKVCYFDLAMQAGTQERIPLPDHHNAFIYLYQGQLSLGQQGRTVQAQQLAVLTNPSKSDGVLLQAAQDSRVLILAGQPLGEPIAQYGPFVMNTATELEQALQDFRTGRF